MSYPTPPHSTSSAKDLIHEFKNNYYDAARYPYQQPPEELTSIPPFPMSSHHENDSYYHPWANDGYGHGSAQETYFSHSLPTSPTLHQEQLAFSTTSYNQPYESTYHPAPSKPSYSTTKPTSKPPKKPHRAHSLSTFFSLSGTNKTSKPPKFATYSSRPGTPTSSRPSKPDYSYGSTSRPRPRPGLVRSILRKLGDAIRRVLDLGKRHPVWLGALSVLPVLVGAGMVRFVKGLGRYLTGEGEDEKSRKRQKEMYRRFEAGEKSNRTGGTKSSWGGELFKDFRGFGAMRVGTESLDGVMKVVQMLINHWCRLSPSAVARAASILLDLYFLDVKTVE